MSAPSSTGQKVFLLLIVKMGKVGGETGFADKKTGIGDEITLQPLIASASFGWEHVSVMKVDTEASLCEREREEK